MELGPPVHPFIREFPIKSRAADHLLFSQTRKKFSSFWFQFDAIWWEHFTNDSAFNADNGLESLKWKMWQKHIFSLSLPLAPTWFSVLGYFEDGNLELNIEYWSRWEVFKSRQIGFRRAHFNRVQWYLWNFSSAIHWGSEIRCNTLHFRHLESFPHPELSSQEFYNCRRESTVGGLLNEKKLWFVLKYSLILKFRKMQAKRDLTKIIYTYMYSVVFMDPWVTFFGPPCIKNVSGETTKGHRLSQVLVGANFFSETNWGQKVLRHTWHISL